MLGVRVQPWSMRYFGAAVVSLMLALAALTAIPLVTAQTLPLPLTLVAVHLVTIGWVSLLMLGALHQFVPVITTRELWNTRLPGWTLALVAFGLGAMVIGFMGLAQGPLARLPWAVSLLPLGGSAVVAGFMLAVLNLGLTLVLSRPLGLSARYVACALAFSLLTVSLGLTFAIAFGARQLLPAALAPLIGAGLALHVLTGIGGWLTLTAMGVALKLLSMFMLAPEQRQLLGEAAWALTALGVAVGWVAGMAALFDGASWLMAVGLAGWAMAGLGVALYLIDMARLYRSRRRQKLELNAQVGGWALGGLGLSGLLAVGFAMDRFSVQLGIAAAFLALFGWLSGLGLSQLYKIVPFLTWIERYGQRMGKEKVPLVQHLVEEERAWPYYRLYFGSVAVATLSLAIGSPFGFHLATAIALISVLGIGRELWRVRHADLPAARAADNPPWPLRLGHER